MSAPEYGPNHIRRLLENYAPDEDTIAKLAEVADLFVRQQDWQHQVNDVIIKAHRKLTEGDPTNSGQPLKIHTDGSCIGNPGPGGWCAIIITADGEATTLQGGHWETTNNRMELQAVISGLMQASKHLDVDVWSDSQYVCKAFNDRWLDRWMRNGWRTRTGPVLNQDMWTSLVDLVRGNGKRDVRFHWVKGHSGDPMNEEADRIARENARRQGGRNSGNQRRARSNR